MTAPPSAAGPSAARRPDAGDSVLLKKIKAIPPPASTRACAACTGHSKELAAARSLSARLGLRPADVGSAAATRPERPGPGLVSKSESEFLTHATT